MLKFKLEKGKREKRGREKGRALLGITRFYEFSSFVAWKCIIYGQEKSK